MKYANRLVLITLLLCLPGCGGDGADGVAANGDGEQARQPGTSSEAQPSDADSTGRGNSAESPDPKTGTGRQQSQTDEPIRDAATSPKATVASDAGIQILDWDEMLALVAQQKGKVVVLDLWSHSCVPCLQEFPNLVALSKKYPDTVACIGLNLDYTGLKSEPPESFRDDVRDTLARHDAHFLNAISKVPDIELSDRLGFGAIPAVYVFDQQGIQVSRFDNLKAESEADNFTYEKNVIPLVETLLARQLQ